MCHLQPVPGSDLVCIYVRKFVPLFLIATLTLAACSPEPRAPDLTTRDDFAQKVMTTAASGSIDEVEKLVVEDRINVHPQAEQLVKFAQGWNPASAKFNISNDFPEIANVKVTKAGTKSAIGFVITWSQERWSLILGDPAHPPNDGAKGGRAPTPEPTKNVTGSPRSS